MMLGCELWVGDLARLLWVIIRNSRSPGAQEIGLATFLQSKVVKVVTFCLSQLHRDFGRKTCPFFAAEEISRPVETSMGFEAQGRLQVGPARSRCLFLVVFCVLTWQIYTLRWCRWQMMGKIRFPNMRQRKKVLLRVASIISLQVKVTKETISEFDK